MKRFIKPFLLISILNLFFFNLLSSDFDDWQFYGKGPGGGHYSKAEDITPENVHLLEQAWVYRSGDFHEGGSWHDGLGSSLQTSFQVTPLVVDDSLIFCTPYNRVISLDAETGEEEWSFDPKLEIEGKAVLHCRGVSSWKDSKKRDTEPCYHKIITATMDAELITIDGKTGKICEGFGVNGKVDLRKGLGSHDPSHYWSTSPPAIINDKIILGGSVIDNIKITVPGGVVRAYDIRTGELVWYWDPIPPNQEPIIDEVGTQLYQRGTTNVWSIISVDEELGLIYLPTGNTSPDYYGGLRNGLDYYSSSVIALNEKDGSVVWNFQTVHHDVWDYDLPSQPTFYDYQINGQTTKALVQTTKTGLVFLLNRKTGKPIFNIEEKPVPQNPVKGEYLSPTQPFPTIPKPLTPSFFDVEDAWGMAYFDKRYCKLQAKKFRSEGLYTPPSLQGSIHYPSAIGGNNWGGPAVDQKRNIMVVNVMNMASVIVMIPREDCDKAVEDLAKDKVLSNFTAIEPLGGTPYCNLRSMGFYSPLGVPCTAPPWGSLVAVDLNSGEHLWNVPLGTSKDLAPFPFWWIKGAPNLGGPTVTATGVTFIAATTDFYLRAFNTETGEELKRFRLPTGGHATPMTYKIQNGKQYVVIAAGGHWAFGSPPSDHLIAYSLPK